LRRGGNGEVSAEIFSIPTPFETGKIGRVEEGTRIGKGERAKRQAKAQGLKKKKVRPKKLNLTI